MIASAGLVVERDIEAGLAVGGGTRRGVAGAPRGVVDLAGGARPRRLVRHGAGAVRREPRRSPRARWSHCSAPTAPASRPCCGRSPGSPRPTSGPSSSTDATSPTPHPTRSRRSASRPCPVAPGCSPGSACARTCGPRAGWCAATAPARRPDSRGARGVPRAGRAAGGARVEPVGRPAADARPGDGAVVAAQAPDHRRAEPRPGAGGGRQARRAGARGGGRRDDGAAGSSSR
jgi:hypothetical protein